MKYSNAKFFLLAVIVLCGLLFPQSVQAELTIADIMGPPFNASTTNIAQIVLDNVNPMMDTDPDFAGFSSSNDPYGAQPHPDDKGRGVKAEEAAAMSQMGVLDAQGKASVLSVTGILLQTTSLIPAPGGFGLMLDPERVEAGGIILAIGQKEGEQLAAMTNSYQKNYAQQQLLRNNFGEPDASTSTIGFANDTPPGAPQNLDAPASVGSLGLYDALGLDAAAAQSLLNSGDIAGFQDLLRDGIENSGFKPDPENSSGSLAGDFFSSIGVSPASFYAKSAVRASDRGGGLRVEGTDEKLEDPFFLDVRQDIRVAQLGVTYAANEDNAGGAGPSQFATSLSGSETGGLEDPSATGRRQARGNGNGRVRDPRLSLRRRDLDEKKLQKIGIVRPMPGSTIFDVARSSYSTWRQYRNQLFLARGEDLP